MSVSIPLSYGSIKSIIEHLDPNLRIQISERCPSLRTAEKSTPMAIQYLEMDRGSYRLNNLTYHLETTVDCEDEKFEVVDFDFGQIFYTDDFNQFGVANFAEHDIIEAGDIKIPVLGMGNYRSMRNAAEEATRDRAEYMAEAQESNDVADVFSNVQYGLRFSVWENGTMIREEKMEKEPKRIRHALSYLADKLFAGRVGISVCWLKIHENPGAYRLPLGFSLRIQKLEIEHNASAVLNAIAPIIDDRSFPLERISIEGYSYIDIENYIHPHIENSKMVTFVKQEEAIDESPPPMHIEEAMLATQCKMVALHSSVGDFTDAMVRNIIDRLLTTSPPQKTHLRLQSKKPERIQTTHRMLEAMHGDNSEQIGYYGCDQFPTGFIFQLDSSTKLVVYCLRYSERDMWNLHFNVVTNERYNDMKMRQ